MTHPRLIPGNNDVALLEYEDQVSARRYVQGKLQHVSTPLANLLRAPFGALDRQVLFGQSITVIADDPTTGYSLGRCNSDGYVGYIKSDCLAKPQINTHKVCALSTHVYPSADMKTLPLHSLPFAAQIAVTARQGDFFQTTDGGYIPHQHLAEMTDFANDYVAVFERFLGTPYLWGGDSPAGMDCSGAVQLALHSAGKTCPRDSDMQEGELGTTIAATDLRRGDLVFWAGHVAVMVDKLTILHANAHHMVVAREPLAGAILRIASNGGGNITALKRL